LPLTSLRKLSEPLPTHITKANTPYYTDISTKLSSISADLTGINSWRYARQVSGGCQEYIEAASFEHYLTNTELLTYGDARAKLKALSSSQGESEGERSAGVGVELGYEDYLLGIYDMTGELMRFAITAMATSGSLPSPKRSQQDSELMEVDSHAASAATQRNILTDLRALRSSLEELNTASGPFSREVDKKMDVMKQSVDKVEKALYGLTVRGAERPKGWMPDLSAAHAVEVEG